MGLGVVLLISVAFVIISYTLFIAVISFGELRNQEEKIKILTAEIKENNKTVIELLVKISKP